MKTWRIRYKDSKSNGRVVTMFYSGNFSRYQIINYYGLNQPDCYWFELKIMNDINLKFNEI